MAAHREDGVTTRWFRWQCLTAAAASGEPGWPVMTRRAPAALGEGEGSEVWTDCHTRFLRPKPDAHRMYVQDQVVIHTVRM
jgi:hypothetical protein